MTLATITAIYNGVQVSMRLGQRLVNVEMTILMHYIRIFSHEDGQVLYAFRRGLPKQALCELITNKSIEKFTALLDIGMHSTVALAIATGLHVVDPNVSEWKGEARG